MAVETREENEFIKRVIDVEEKDMAPGDSYWALGGKRVGNGDVIWVQTGNRIGSANWHVWHGNENPQSKSGNYYIYMIELRNRRQWIFRSDDFSLRFICEAS